MVYAFRTLQSHDSFPFSFSLIIAFSPILLPHFKVYLEMSLRSVVNALVRRENFQEKSKAEYIEDEHQPRHQWKTHRYKENGSQLKPDGTMERQSRGRSDKDYLSSPIHRREHRQNHQHLDRTSHKHYSRKLTANSRSPSPVSPVDHNQHGIFQSSKQPAIWNTHSDTQDSEYEDKFSRLLGIVTKPMSSGDTHSVSSSRSAPAADQTIKVQALWLSLYSHRGSFSDFTLKVFRVCYRLNFFTFVCCEFALKHGVRS